MNKTTRQELNKRFKEVYGLLVSRKEIIKSDRQKSKSAFAEQIGTKGHIIDLYLRGERKITYDQAKKLCSKYGVSETYMFQGEGQAFESLEQSNTNKLARALGISFSPNILYTNMEAFAGNTVGVDLLEENEWFHIPGVSGDLIAFNINGDSMAPTINTGDMVICKPLESNSEMVDGEVYAIVTNQSIWVKRVRKYYNPYQKWTHLQLISDNKEEYDPFYVELNEVQKLLKVKRRLTGLT